MALHAVAASLFAAGSENDWQVKAVEALDIFRELGDTRLEVSELQNVAQLHLQSGDPTSALEPLTQALDLVSAEAAGTLKESQLLEYLVQAHLELGEVDVAWQIAEDGLGRCWSAGEKRGEAALQHLLVSIYFATEDVDAAASAAEAALKIYREELKDPRGESRVLQTVSWLHLGREQFDKAAVAANAAMKMLRQLGDQEEAAKALEALCQAYLKAGQKDKALQAAEELRADFQKAGDAVAEATALLVAASAHLLGGETERCTAAARQAQVLFDKEGHLHGQAQALLMVAEAGMVAGKCKGAQHAAQRARRLFKQAGDEPEEARALVLASRADIAMLRNGSREPTRTAWAAALQLATEGLEYARYLGDRALEASALCQVAQARASTGDHEESLQASEEAVQLYRQAGNAKEEASAVLLGADAHLKAGHGEEARERAEEALRLAQQCGAGPVQALGRKLLEAEAKERVRLASKLTSEQGAAAEQWRLPSQLVRTETGDIIDMRSGLTLRVAERRHSAVAARRIFEHYCEDEFDDEVPLMQPGLTTWKADGPSRSAWRRSMWS